MRWQPNVTVAAVIERDDKFLLVEENINNVLQLNQPAGHWEYGETLVEAVIRETLEETAWHFTPSHLIGIYHWQHPSIENTTFLRFTFTGELLKQAKQQILDAGIERTVWMNLQEIKNSVTRHRSPQLLLCVEDYLEGKRYPLDCITVVK